MDPFFVLQVPRDADDTAIRAAYLKAVQSASPESDPVRFRTLSAAYETIKTAPLRRDYEFTRTMTLDETPLSLLRKCLSFHPPESPPNFDSMKEYLRSCLKRIQ